MSRCGIAREKIKAANKILDDWLFTFTVRDGKLSHIRKYIDTQALALASKTDAYRHA